MELKTSFPHDHTALNDARTIASFFIQTWRQMEILEKSLEEKVKAKNPLVIEKYNPQWAVFFESESQKIKSVMGENAVEIYHVGSTSIPNLAAKPIVDMILVTKDLKSAREFLTSEELGYRYKGEYNLPLRDLYGKKGDFEVYLHVHRINNPETKLNLLFRDYLRNNDEARKQYESVKITASKEQNASEKVGTGITKYNLLKNDLIVSILEKTGFSGVCPRFVTQRTESEYFAKIRRNFFENLGIEDGSLLPDQNVKKIVLYRGVDLVGAAEITNISADRFLISFAWTNDNGQLLKKLLSMIEDWVKTRTKSQLLEATVGPSQARVYLNEGFIHPIESNDRYFVKEV